MVVCAIGRREAGAGRSSIPRSTSPIVQWTLSHAVLGVGFPSYLLIHQRGEMSSGTQGDRAGALQDFSTAVNEAGLWRQGALPARSSLVAANVELETRVFRSYIETAAGESLRSHANELAGESFEAAELNRSASMRDSLSLRDAWRRKVSLEYWQTAAQLRTEQRPEKAAQLELALTEMEAKAGLGEFSNKIENFRGRNSLIHFRGGLRDSAVFLSLYLGEKESYLWAVTQNSLSMHRLPAAKEIRREIREFRKTIRGATSNDRKDPGVEAQSSDRWEESVHGWRAGGYSPFCSASWVKRKRPSRNGYCRSTTSCLNCLFRRY